VRPAVAPDEDVGEAVSMYWYHEVLDLPAADPHLAKSSATQQRWIHYGALQNRKDNFHYLGGNRNQLLPLISNRHGNRATRSLSQAGKNTLTTALLYAFEKIRFEPPIFRQPIGLDPLP
jgi:hypothetical protein